MMKEETRRWLNEQFCDDGETVTQVWKEYLDEMSSKVASARAAFAAADYPLLDRLAHTLKGNALMIGDQEMASAAVSLRDASKASDAAGVEAALGRIESLDAGNRE